MAKANARKDSPFDLGAAYAAKLSADDGQVRFNVGGADFVMPSAARWTEDELDETNRMTPFEILRKALGDEQYERLREVAAMTPVDPEAVVAEGSEPEYMKFDLHMAKALLAHYLRASGLGSLGE